MPELPEVETSRRGISPHITGKQVEKIIIRNKRLRWPIPDEIKSALQKQTIISVERRGKYLLLNTASGTALLHLGMSGSLRIVAHGTAAGKHDHVDILFNNNKTLRLTDPRRFGALLWTTEAALEHPLLRHLGPEPLSDDFDGNYLWSLSRKRTTAIKTFIMNSKVVVGVGNIYANEALFAAGIHPLRAANKVSKARYQHLVECIKDVLAKAIEQGGTTLKDFAGVDGKPGYFKQSLNVYGRAGEPCVLCNKDLIEKRLGQRSTVYCGVCQR